jgi:alanine racemase
VAVAKEAQRAGAACLGVLTIEEARILRENRIRLPIHVLSPILPQQAALAARLDVSLTVDDMRQASAIDKAAGKRPLDVHIDLDFGLGRWGLPPKQAEDFAGKISRLKKIRLAGLSTHVDYVPGKNSVECEEKLRAFSRIAQKLKLRYPNIVCHAANSSVMIDFPHRLFDMARVGNLIYGINAAVLKLAPLKNPWSFRARIMNLRDVPRGRSIGYASEYVAPRAMRVATLAVGYADGLTMEPAERLISLGSGFQYWGMLRGAKTPFVGRCGISHVLVDVTDAPSARLGDMIALPIRRTAASAALPRFYR